MLHLLLAAAALVATPADDPQEKTVVAATEAMNAGRPEQALTTVEPALTAYERRHAGERRQLYCSYSPVETVAEMAAAAAARQDAVALPTSGWCDALFIKGYALADLKRFAEARPVLERAVAMAPLHAHFINELGYVYQQQRDWQLSYDTYQRARDATAYSERERFAPEKGRALRGMGFALIELGRWDEAEALFNESLVLEPNNANALNELRYIAQQRRRPKA